MKKLIAGAIVGAVIGLSGCSAPGESLFERQVAFDKAYKSAKAAKSKAASVGGEWRDIGKMLKKAKKAADNHDWAKATKLAKKAKQQGEFGYAQALAEQKLRAVDPHPSYL